MPLVVLAPQIEAATEEFVCRCGSVLFVNRQIVTKFPDIYTVTLIETATCFSTKFGEGTGSPQYACKIRGLCAARSNPSTQQAASINDVFFYESGLDAFTGAVFVE